MVEKKIVIDERLLWNVVEASPQLAVVQVYASVSEYNWEEPYRFNDQNELFGSGFFINEFGLIATNAHLVINAQSVFVRVPFFKERFLEAEVFRIFPELDLAILMLSEKTKAILQKHKIKKVPFITIGNSNNVRRTQSVLVLGYPYGTMTLKGSTGVVSGKEHFKDITFLQITAPINEGNSGCPVLDQDGTAIGIVSAIMQHAQNVGYAIPIQTLINAFEEFDTAKETLQRKNIWGIHYVISTDEKAAWLKNPLPSGLYIAQVFENSVLSSFGVQPGDMLYEIEGCRINGYGEVQVPWNSDLVPLSDFLLHFHPGKTMSGILYRKGKKIKFGGKIQFCNPFSIKFRFPYYENIEYETIGGIVVMELTLNHVLLFREDQIDLIKYINPESWYKAALIITHVMPGSILQRSMCLMEGDIIKTINGTPVSTLSELREAIFSTKTEFFALETDKNILCVENMKTIIEEEEQLCTRHNMPLSDFMKKLIKSKKI